MTTDVNVLIRGQSNAALFTGFGAAGSLEQQLEARLPGVDIHILGESGTATSTMYPATGFLDWPRDGEQQGLLNFIRAQPTDIRDNPTVTLWMHNEYDANTPGVTTDQWTAAVRADAVLVRDALGQGVATTPYVFTYVNYPFTAAGSPEAIKAGMNQLSADPGFNARFDSTALNGLAMDGPGEPPGGHIGFSDAYVVAGRLAGFIADTVAVLPPVSLAATAVDYNGDRLGDLVWQNYDGTIAQWQMNGAGVIASAVVANPGLGWMVVGNGDFDANGRGDILLQNQDGRVAEWQMNGAAIAAGTVVANPGPAWSVQGVRDFDADGRADILFRHQDGSVALWQMNGPAIAAGTVIGNPGNGYAIAGTGDFNGDQRADILWRGTDGSFSIWQMNGPAIASAGAVGNPGLAWKAIGIADFNGDGRSDILWQHDNGTVALWQMNGTAIAASTVVANPGPAWQAKVIGDFTGDGLADIVWRNVADGSVAEWTMNGATIAGSSLVPNPGADWYLT